MSADPATGESREWHELILSVASLNIAGILATFGAPALVLLPYILVWRDPMTMFGAPGLVDILLGFVVLLFSIVVHEGLHAVGFWLAGASLKNIHFGFNREYLTPYAHCDVAVSASTYRFAVALPALVLGVAPAVVGIVVRSAWLAAFGGLMIAVAVGDLMILWTLRGVSGSARVKDHPNKPGCLVQR